MSATETIKMRIQIASIHPIPAWFRQTPGHDGVWEDAHFVPHDAAGAAEWLIVYDEAPAGFTTTLPRERRILFRSEPESIKHYPRAYLDQFGWFVSISPMPAYGDRVFVTTPALPWMYGLDLGGSGNHMPWQALLSARNAPPRGEISVVCSTKAMNLNQMRRLRFLEMLREALGERLHLFGRGFSPINDKAEGITGFRYHLVLENNLLDHGWTEKLADPILAGAFPIVSGGRNLAQYFDPEGFASIDTTRPRAAVEDVLRLLAEDPAARAGAAMAANKQRLMAEHNFFPHARGIIRQIEAKGVAGATPVAPVALFAPARSKLDKLFSLPKVLRKPLRSLYLSLAERE